MHVQNHSLTEKESGGRRQAESAAGSYSNGTSGYVCAHRCHRLGAQSSVSAASLLSTSGSLLKLQPRQSVGIFSHRHRRKSQRKGREGGSMEWQWIRARPTSSSWNSCGENLYAAAMLLPSLPNSRWSSPSPLAHPCPPPLPAFFALPPCLVPAPLPLAWLLWAAAASAAPEMGRERAGRCSSGAADLPAPGALRPRQRSRRLAVPRLQLCF